MKNQITLQEANKLAEIFTPVEKREEATGEILRGFKPLDLETKMPTHLVDTQLAAYALLKECLFELETWQVALCGSLVNTSSPSPKQLKCLKDFLKTFLPNASF